MFTLQPVTTEALANVLPKGDVFGVPSKEFGVRLFLARLDVPGFALNIMRTLFEKKKVPKLVQFGLEAYIKRVMNVMFERFAADITKEVADEDVRMLLVMLPPSATLQSLVEDIASDDFEEKLKAALDRLPEGVGNSREELFEIFMELQKTVKESLAELDQVYQQAG